MAVQSLIRKKNMAKGMVSLQKGLDILCCFDYDHQALSVLEISERMNIPQSTTYRYITVLLNKGFLTKDFESNKYTVGHMVFQIGSTESPKYELVDLTKPYLTSLASLSGETVVLGVLKGWKALFIEIIESTKTVRVTPTPGSSIPLHAGAAAKTLLAYQTEAFVDAMIREVGLSKLTRNTITDPDQLKTALKHIREHGFAFGDSEVEPLACAVAAPIFDHKKSLVASIAVLAPKARMAGKNVSKFIDMVKKTALEISCDLGYGKAKEGFPNTQTSEKPHGRRRV